MLRLVDRLWPRLPLALLGLALVVAVVSYATGAGPSDREQIEDLVTDFAVAASDRNGDDLCPLLTERAKADVTRLVPGTDCEGYARSFGVSAAGFGGLRIVVPDEIPAGRVVLDRRNLRDPAGEPVTRTLEVVETEDGWKIDRVA